MKNFLRIAVLTAVATSLILAVEAKEATSARKDTSTTDSDKQQRRKHTKKTDTQTPVPKDNDAGSKEKPKGGKAKKPGGHG